jgi:PhnB protein
MRETARIDQFEEQAMSRVSTYIAFNGRTEEAFNFYRSVFGGDFIGPINRFADVPCQPGQPAISEAHKNLVMHMELPILAGHVLMGTDGPAVMGFKMPDRSNVHINLEPDTRAEVDALFAALSQGGEVETTPREMFWGGYFGSLTDKVNIQWLLNCASKT